ncbi:uncharacterized protein YktB (UPF0637 family) [Scopulibacillus darangshiensis]|uniref:UPF0637 protein EV207_10546 n=1 Tax=Scopulibacillus darangshiensis TaxID=442528 RepID=A0A4R2P6X5_9BACL|nr:DUF1054 domain-containing protein [Scopulibacillus darangshiensis]TCP30517.1 uncharacterized protein YktB (UPF0637 family) [Scopulibacillus darangshiensis]
MIFKGFTKSDFNVFSINGLDERMAAIQNTIQPKFQAIGNELTDTLSSLTGNEMYLHIAKHARRTVNPPKDTWLAICSDKRGYKKHPHFQIGLFGDHVFIWLAYINELAEKQEVAKRFLNHRDDVRSMIPRDYVISVDHTKNEAEAAEQADFTRVLQRFHDVKKAEFLVGRHIPADDPVLKNGEAIIKLAEATFDTLMPIYKLSYK